MLKQQETISDQEYKHEPKWEYAEIWFSRGLGMGKAYIWVYQDGKLNQLKGIKGKNKAMVALERIGKQGWELVAATSGEADDRSGTVRLFLKRPRQK